MQKKLFAHSMKNHIILLIFFILSSCKQQETDPILQDTAIDITPPIHGSDLVVEQISSTSLKLSWTAASDNSTPQALLQYKVITANSLENLQTIEDIEKISGEHLRVDWTSNIAATELSSLKTYTSYYIAVVVKDLNNNKNIYPIIQQKTTCGCAAGEYAENGECKLAESGYWADQCVKTECSNAPNDTRYIGLGTPSAQCSFVCDHDFIPNNNFNACISSPGVSSVSCAPNQLLVGFEGRSDQWLEQLGARCQNYADGKLFGDIIKGSEYGTSSLSFFKHDCPEGYVVSEIHHGNFESMGNGYAGFMRFRCRRISDGELSPWLPQGNGNTGATNPFCGNNNGDYLGQCANHSISNESCPAPYAFSWISLENSYDWTGYFKNFYGCKLVIPEDQLMAVWKLDNNTYNSFNQNYHAQPFGNVEFSQAQLKFGSHSAYFRGQNNTFISVQNPLLNDLTSFSISGWIYIVDRGSLTNPVSFWGQKNALQLGFNKDGMPNDLCVSLPKANKELCSSQTLEYKKWHHVVVTVSELFEVKLYINGVMDTSTILENRSWFSTDDFTIGGKVWDTDQDYLKGNVDDILIYSRELSSEEVKTLLGKKL